MKSGETDSTWNWVSVAISCVLSAALGVALFSETSPGELREVFGQLDVSYLVAFLILSLTGLVLRAIRYAMLLEMFLKDAGESSLSFFRVLLVTGVRNAFVDLLPARLGELSYIYLLNRLGVRLASAISTFGICIVLDFIALGIIIAGASLWFELPGMQSSLLPVIPVDAGRLPYFILFAVGAFAVGYYMLLRLGSILKKLLPMRNRMFAGIVADLETLGRTRGVWKLLVVTIFLRAAKYGGLYFLALSVLAQWNVGSALLNPLLVFAVFIVSEASASLPVSGLMGFGLYEGVWSTLFRTSCGTACSNIPTVTVAFVVHLASQVAGYGIALLFLAVIAWIFFLRARGGNREKPWLPSLSAMALVSAILLLAPQGRAESLESFKVTNPFGAKGRIAFSAKEGEDSSLFVLDLARGAVNQITERGIWASWPSWSPDGAAIAYTGRVGARRVIFVMAAAAGSAPRILSDPATNSDNPSWSPKGDRIVFYAEDPKDAGSANLFLADTAKPGPPQRLTRFRGRNTTPRWSPDGNAIAFSTDRFPPGWDICVVDLPSGRERCPLHGVQTYCRPRYSHNGSLLAYSSGIFESVDIYLRDLRSGGDRKLTSIAGRDYDATWAPDDGMIAFTNNGSGNEHYELFMTRLSDGSSERILDTPKSVRYLDWGR